MNDTATTEIYTLSLHDALPIWAGGVPRLPEDPCQVGHDPGRPVDAVVGGRLVQEAEHRLLDGLVVELARGLGLAREQRGVRSEEHTSELQSRQYLVCRLLLEKKKHVTL